MAGKSGVSVNWGGFKEAVDRTSSGISDTQALMTKIGMAMKGQTVSRQTRADILTRINFSLVSLSAAEPKLFRSVKTYPTEYWSAAWSGF